MQTIKLDISAKNNVQPIYVKQRDVGHNFAIELYENGTPYSVDDENTFAVWYSGASGDGNYTTIGDETAVFANRNVITVQMIMQMLNEPGGHEMCVVMYGQDNQQKGFWNIPYFVEAIPGADSAVAQQYYTAFLETVARAETAAGKAEAAANSLTNSLEDINNLKNGRAYAFYEINDDGNLEDALIEQAETMEPGTEKLVYFRDTGPFVFSEFGAGVAKMYCYESPEDPDLQKCCRVEVMSGARKALMGIYFYADGEWRCFTENNFGTEMLLAFDSGTISTDEFCNPIRAPRILVVTEEDAESPGMATVVIDCDAIDPNITIEYYTPYASLFVSKDSSGIVTITNDDGVASMRIVRVKGFY